MFKPPFSVPEDVRQWRAFWALPAGYERFKARDWSAWHKWRCGILEQRYGLGIHYDAELADDHMSFFRGLKHTKGKWAGHYFSPLPWQEHQILRPLFGYVRADGTRLYREVFVIVPKKNGKSEIAAGIVLDQLFFEGEPAAEIFGMAKDRDQATLVFAVAAGMVKQEPMLESTCKVLDTTKRIVVPDPHGSDSYYAVASADVKNKEGPSIQALVADEVHVIPRPFYEVMTDGSGASREQPIIFNITTAGDDRTGVCYELLEYSRSLTDGVIEDPAFLPVVYEVPEDEDWESEESWLRANPSMGITIKLEDMRRDYLKAKQIPSKQNSFRRRRLNQWVSSESRYIPMDMWDACGPTGTLNELAAARDKQIAHVLEHKLQGIGWLDLSSRTDITTFGLLFPTPEKVYAIPWFFIPEDNIDKRGERDRMMYRQWTDAGFMETCKGNAIDQRLVRDRINQCRTDGFKFREVAYDDWNAGKIEIELSEEDGFTMVPIAQSISQMNPGTKELLVITLTTRLDHAGNPVLRHMADNLVVTTDKNERVQPNKPKSTARIDGIVGIIMALNRVLCSEEDKPSVYETRGILTIDL